MKESIGKFDGIWDGIFKKIQIGIYIYIEELPLAMDGMRWWSFLVWNRLSLLKFFFIQKVQLISF